jgi:hypothetical protein
MGTSPLGLGSLERAANDTLVNYLEMVLITACRETTFMVGTGVSAPAIRILLSFPDPLSGRSALNAPT